MIEKDDLLLTYYYYSIYLTIFLQFLTLTGHPFQGGNSDFTIAHSSNSHFLDTTEKCVKK